MAYSDFTLREVIDRFQLSLVDSRDLFADVPEAEPGPLLSALLPEFLPLALAIDTEKARSELVIAPLLAALRAQTATSSCRGRRNSSSCEIRWPPSSRP